MAKTPENSGKPWTAVEIVILKRLIAGNTPTRVIAMKMDRSEDAIYAKVQDLGLSLKPTNQSPYNRRK